MKNKFIKDWCDELEKVIYRLNKDKLKKGLDLTFVSRAWLGAMLEGVHWWILTDFKMKIDRLVELSISFVLNGVLGMRF